MNSAGRWAATVPIWWTSDLVATYCAVPATCWDNPYAPAFQTGSKIIARWAPRLGLPSSRPQANRPSRYTVKVPASYAGVPVVLKARIKGTWRRVGKAKVTAGTARVTATLPAGKVKVRALVATSSRPWVDGSTARWMLRKVSAGRSAIAVVRVKG